MGSHFFLDVKEYLMSLIQFSRMINKDYILLRSTFVQHEFNINLATNNNEDSTVEKCNKSNGQYSVAGGSSSYLGHRRCP